MSFLRAPEDFMKVLSGPKKLTADVIWIYFETTPDVIKRLLPPPLKPVNKPLAIIWGMDVKKATYCEPCIEIAIGLVVQYKEETGVYVIGMGVNDDMVLVGGREVMGYPKKIARLTRAVSGNKVSFSAERHGITYVSIEATLDGKYGDPGFPAIVDAYLRQKKMLNFQYKPYAEPNAGFDKMHINLNRIFIKAKTETNELGSATVKLTKSQFDPWAEIEVVKVLGAARSKGEFEDVDQVEEVPALEIMKYTTSKTDALPDYYLKKYTEG
jgi:acetoacetate decarboxylase